MTDVVLIANPVAGRGEAPAVAERVAHLARGRDLSCRVVVSESAEATRAAAQRAARDGARIVAPVGGDGTVHHVAAGLLAVPHTDCALLPIAAGSGNDFARCLGLPRHWRDAVPLLWSGQPRRFDVLSVQWADGSHNVAINALSAGFDAEVAELVAASRRVTRPAAYLTGVLRGLATLRHRALTVTLDGTATSGRILFVAVNNGAWYGGGMRVAPHARPDDGWLDVGIAGPISRLDALFTLPRFYAGTHLSHRLCTALRARTVRIDGEPAPVQLDGELVGALPLDVAISPGALTVVSA